MDQGDGSVYLALRAALALALWESLPGWVVAGEVGQDYPVREGSFCLHGTVHFGERGEPGATSFRQRGMVLFFVEEVVVDLRNIQMALLYFGCQKGCLGYSLLFGLKLELPLIHR